MAVSLKTGTIFTALEAVANMKHTHIRSPVKCLTDGMIYLNANQAAKAIGATRAAMSNHLAGRIPSLRGKKFQRVDVDLATIVMNNTMIKQLAQTKFPESAVRSDADPLYVHTQDGEK